MRFSIFHPSLQLLRVSLVLCCGLLLSSCAHLRTTSLQESDLDVPAPKSLTDVLQEDLDPSPVTFNHGKLVVQGVPLKETHFDIPIKINTKVEQWIQYFTGKGRPYFQKYLERSEFFIPYIAPILKQNGLPEDLVYLAMIESGFNNLARSSATAVGPWQFMATTGKRYGLMVNWWIDQRRDIQKSTLSAVGFLKDLYSIFQNWELAAAAYNAGEAKIARAVKRYGSRDFWTISRSQFLTRETCDYVPKMMAAAIIAKNRTQFGFTTASAQPGAHEAVASDGKIVPVVASDSSNPKEESAYEKDLQAALLLNPDEIEGEEATSREEITQAIARSEHFGEDQPLAKPVATPHLTRTGEVKGEQLADFEVKSPADLLKIARAAGLSYQTVKSLNPEVLRWCTPPYLSHYRIKLPAYVKEKFLVTYNHAAFPRKVHFMTYKVRKKGETLSHIARNFGIRVDPMSDLNRMSTRKPLKHGMEVFLPIPNDRSRTIASLDIHDAPSRSRRQRRRARARSRLYRITQKRPGIQTQPVAYKGPNKLKKS